MLYPDKKLVNEEAEFCTIHYDAKNHPLACAKIHNVDGLTGHEATPRSAHIYWPRRILTYFGKRMARSFPTAVELEVIDILSM